MRIVVDALAGRYGGTAYAAVQVARELAQRDDVTVITRSGSIVASGLGGVADVVQLPSAGAFELPRRLAWEAWRLRRLAGADPVLSWSGMLPRQPHGRLVCVLANPVALRSAAMPDRLRRRAIRRTARRATVVVPSEGMRSLAEPLVGSADVVALGVDARRFSPSPTPGRDVLCVADFYRHKRHDLVIEAWAALPSPRPRLRLVGDPRVDRKGYERARRVIAAHRSAGTIEVEHGLSLSDLIEAYRAARVLVIASEQESFCMPLLEAQACGVPAVARDDPALRTAGGQATTYVADGNLTWAIERLLGDEDAHARARAVGLEHARAFSWARTAAALRERLLD